MANRLNRPTAFARRLIAAGAAHDGPVAPLVKGRGREKHAQEQAAKQARQQVMPPPRPAGHMVTPTVHDAAVATRSKG